MYQSPAMKQFSRSLVYVRPGTFVLFDCTSVTTPAADQWLAFHTAAAPRAVTTADATQKRFDVSKGAATVGSIRMLLPRSSKVTNVALPGGVTRLEAHSAAADQKWLSVVTAANVVPDEVRLSSEDGNVTRGNVVGVHMQSTRNQVVLFSGDQAGTAAVTEARYRVKQTADADHVVADATPSGAYTVTANLADGALAIELKEGGPLKASARRPYATRCPRRERSPLAISHALGGGCPTSG